YQDEQELLEDHAIGAGEGERCGPIEFFDSTGHRLAARYDRPWRVMGLTRTAEPPDPALLRQRVHKTLDHVRRYIEANARKVELLGATVPQLVAHILDLEAGDLDTCLKKLVHSRDDHDHRSGVIKVEHLTNDPLHNWMHGAGWQH
ncbi:MAG TPA: hypothetical protein VHH34_20955, partial [Pseudonocardiaceae bacterium]|nr:hypothetical protein [Pseudonocardiaceae bacterium]